MPTDGPMSAVSGPGADSLPPKKRNSKQNLSEQPLEHIFKTPSPYSSQNGAKRMEHRQEPHPVLQSPPYPSYIRPVWTGGASSTSPFLSSMIRDNQVYSPWRQLLSGGQHPTYPAHLQSDLAASAVQNDFVGPSSAWSYLNAEPRDVLMQNYRRLYGAGSSLVSKSHSQASASHSSRRTFSAELPNGELMMDRLQIPTARHPVHWFHGLQSGDRQRSSYISRRKRERYLTGHTLNSPYASMMDISIPGKRGSSAFGGSSHFKYAASSDDLPKNSISVNSKWGNEKQRKTDSPLVAGNGTGGAVKHEENESSVDLLHIPAHGPSSSSTASPNSYPWLLPHFAVGSLIELRGGQLKKVEDLQVEDFQLCASSCDELRLSSCTIKSISPSHTPVLSRLLVLLEDHRSQDSLEVYTEFPFFVCGRGWSSCDPRRTARLCGLRCRQLCVGDVCLALTPTSASHALPSVPGACRNDEERGCDMFKTFSTDKLTEMQRQAVPRKRHRSAP